MRDAGLGAGDRVPGVTPRTGWSGIPGRRMGRVVGVEGMISSCADVTSNNHDTSVGDTERIRSSHYLTALSETTDGRHGPPSAPGGSPSCTPAQRAQSVRCNKYFAILE